MEVCDTDTDISTCTQTANNDYVLFGTVSSALLSHLDRYQFSSRYYLIFSII